MSKAYHVLVVLSLSNEILKLLILSRKLHDCKQEVNSPCRFPDGIVVGTVNTNSAEVKINPAPGTFVNTGDSLLILRPNGLPKNEYKAAKKQAKSEVGDWSSQDYVRASFDESYMGRDSHYARQLAMTGCQSPPAISLLTCSVLIPYKCIFCVIFAVCWTNKKVEGIL